MRRLLLIAVACAVVGSSPVDGRSQTGGTEEVESLRAELRALRERVERLEASLAAALQALHVYVLPETMAFASEPVPLDRWDVREHLEREFLLSLGNPAQVVLWLKRSARYFPYIEYELGEGRDARRPEVRVRDRERPPAHGPVPGQCAGDLAVHPLDGPPLRPRRTPWWDERRNPESSTAAALAYLKDLHARFGSWPLALAGYNAGEGRVETALAHQGVSSYYQLALPSETERYVFRALAAKLILSEPGATGSRFRPSSCTGRTRRTPSRCGCGVGSSWRTSPEPAARSTERSRS